MIVITKYRLIKDEADERKRCVRSEEKSICPVCAADTLRVIGSRNRRAFDSKGETLIIVIRRLRCLNCQKIHHELPDILVPYKRYLSKCIEAVIEGQWDGISCESSTIHRLRQWFKGMELHIKGSLASVAARMNVRVEVACERLSKSIKAYVGWEPGWLAKTVRILVNTNNWVHTRFAFMT